MSDATTDARVPVATRARSPAWRVVVVLACGSLVAASLGAASLAGWADLLPDGPGTDTLRAAAHGWEAALRATGLPQSLELLHAAVAGGPLP